MLRFWQLRVLWWLGFGDGVVKLDENTNYDGCFGIGLASNCFDDLVGLLVYLLNQYDISSVL